MRLLRKRERCPFSHNVRLRRGDVTGRMQRAVVMHEAGYYEGYYSILDEDERIEFTQYDSEEHLLIGIEDYWPVQRLKWFSKGFYAVDQEQSAVVMSDLRMGVAASYVFRFKVGEVSNPHPRSVEPVRLKAVRELDRMRI